MLLLLRVRSCADDAEYEMLRQQWDSVNRPQYQRRTWSPRQEEALGAVAYAVSLDDEEQKRQHQRCLDVTALLLQFMKIIKMVSIPDILRQYTRSFLFLKLFNR